MVGCLEDKRPTNLELVDNDGNGFADFDDICDALYSSHCGKVDMATKKGPCTTLNHHSLMQTLRFYVSL